MAWYCSAVSNDALIDALLRADLLRTPAVVAAMRRVDRGWFLPEYTPADAYRDCPQPIGFGATISAPHMHAIMMEILAPFVLQRSPSTTLLRVLDVGSGTGYLTAVLAELCAAEDGGRSVDWQVHGIEHVPQLVTRSMDILGAHYPEWVERGQVKVVEGDGRDPVAVLGGEAEKVGQFDVIHVGAAAPAIPPALLQLLRSNGCLVVPVGEQGGSQRLLKCEKDSVGKVTVREDCGVQFVPLTSLQRQLR